MTDERRTDGDRRKIRKVRKAIFPAAGLGTRFLPATKAQPKEMLPLVDKPIIQYGVEEAVAAGCDQIIIITGRGKSAIEDHFDVSYELEKMLEEKGKHDLLKIVRQISDMIYVAYVRQKEALGLGHAVLTARELIGDEPFATLLADDVIDAKVPVLKQLMNVFNEKQCSVHRDADRRRAGDFFLWRAEGERSRGLRRQTLRSSRPGGKAEAGGCAFKSGRDRALHSDADHLRDAFRTSSRARAANCNLPMACADYCSAKRCMPTSMKDAATIPATNSAFSKRRLSSR